MGEFPCRKNTGKGSQAKPIRKKPLKYRNIPQRTNLSKKKQLHFSYFMIKE